MGTKADFINQCVKAYRSLAEHPTIVCAQVLSRNSSQDFIQVVSKWSQRNIEKGEVTKFQRYHLIKSTSSDVVFQSNPTDISSEQLSKYSASEKYKCVVRVSKQENRKKQFIEVWTENGLHRNFDVSSFDIHGDIYTDGDFNSLEWSPSEDKVIYIAEKQGKKTGPFYKQKSGEKKAEEGKEIAVGDEYIFKPDWGEQMVEKHQPVVGICDIQAETLRVLEGIPENFSPGQVLWAKDGNGIFGVALENEPRRLGLIYCSNRLSYIFHLSLKGEFKILSDKDKSVRSPRLSLDGKSMFWLQRSVGGAHGGCQQLVKYDLVTNERQIMIDIMRFGNKIFSGLYLNSLPARCFSKNSTKLFFSTCNRLKTMSYYLDLDTKEIHAMETEDGSGTILDVHNDIILLSATSLQRPAALKLSKSVTKIEWIPITKADVIFKDSVVKEMEFDSKNSKDKFTYYNAIYYGPKPPGTSGQKVPLILNPHGGPHSAFLNDFYLETNFFVSIGFGVLMVNYRGSTGVGQDGIEFLLGNISDTDAKDNHESVLYLLKNIPYLDSKNVFLLGKSHGGYLVEHLSAQYPDFYRAVVSLNPVIDLAGMYLMSDIPDWAMVECGLPFDESKPLTFDQINKLNSVSPAHLADKIKAPTLFMIGKNDLRVPFFEGIKMYYALKARKIKVRLNLYNDNHTLSSVPNNIDCIINAAIWFFENKAK